MGYVGKHLLKVVGVLLCAGALFYFGLRTGLWLNEGSGQSDLYYVSEPPSPGADISIDNSQTPPRTPEATARAARVPEIPIPSHELTREDVQRCSVAIKGFGLSPSPEANAQPATLSEDSKAVTPELVLAERGSDRVVLRPAYSNAQLLLCVNTLDRLAAAARASETVAQK